ncbi:hypothetical protein [Halomonas sp.]|uniref:hypothetical protein n=1 Tax=Halomonas sp. TaxID=1486246 RepID=UPI00298D9FB6|nr:hypothetical protein [Halomonas sp.]MDW7745647.1 hypothetical protein [Halomonas sp.]
MSTFTYHHYSPFNKKYLRVAKKQLGFPKKAPVEREVMSLILDDPQILYSINSEIFMLEWFHEKTGHVIIPSPSVSVRVSNFEAAPSLKGAWRWPVEFTTVSLPHGLTFGGHQVEGILVGWLKSSDIADYKNELLRHHNVEKWSEPLEDRDWRLIVAIPNPVEENPVHHPTMLLTSLTSSEINYFMESDVLAPLEGWADPLEDEEYVILRAAAKYVISMGTYMTSHPDAIKMEKPKWLKNRDKNNKNKKWLTVEDHLAR